MASLSTYINSIPLASRPLIWEEEFLLKPPFWDYGGLLLYTAERTPKWKQVPDTQIAVNH